MESGMIASPAEDRHNILKTLEHFLRMSPGLYVTPKDAAEALMTRLANDGFCIVRVRP
jgi:hypothetical protein